MKDELFDSLIIEFIFSFFRNYLNTQNINFTNCKILILQMVKFKNFKYLIVFRISQS